MSFFKSVSCDFRSPNDKFVTASLMYYAATYEVISLLKTRWKYFFVFTVCQTADNNWFHCNDEIICHRTKCQLLQSACHTCEYVTDKLHLEIYLHILHTCRIYVIISFSWDERKGLLLLFLSNSPSSTNLKCFLSFTKDRRSMWTFMF